VLLVTEEAADVIKSYDEYIVYKQIMYMDAANKLLQLYLMPVLALIDCLAETCGNKNGNRPTSAKTAIRRVPIRNKSIFRVPSTSGSLTVVRMDLAESFLARDFRGFRLSEIPVED
jgi:hypothetical protein